jgi:glycosyltransferase involved in cell wall biosynthesis
MRNAQIKPHVLMVCNHLGEKASTTWAGIFVERQIASLERAGVRVTTFDIGRSYLPVHIVKKWLELRKLVKRLDPDLVHAQYGTITGFVSTFVGKPTVISYCGNDLLGGAPISKGRRWLGFFLSNVAALRARALVCKSTQLRQALWWRQHRATVIPNGVDLNLFVPGSQNEARIELGWNLENPIVIINSGMDPKRKGIHLAQAAMSFVRARLPNAELRVISNVEPTRMVFHYRAADVLLSASVSEGSPNVVKEALACNLPIVSTPVGDVSERLANVQPSVVVSRDAEAIGNALVRILLERKRSNGRENVVRLSLENIAERVLDVYRTVLCDVSNKDSGVSTHE